MENKNDINIRMAGYRDLGILSQFQIACAFESEGKKLVEETVENGIEKILFNAPENIFGHYFIIENRKKEIKGCFLVQYQLSDWNNAYYLLLESIYIHPTERGRGVLDAILNFAKDYYAPMIQCVCEIRLNVSTANQRMIRALSKTDCTRSGYEVFHLAI